MTYAKKLAVAFTPFLTTLAELFGSLILAAIGLFAFIVGIWLIGDYVVPAVKSVAACPIHVTTTDTNGYGNDYCLHIGVGQ